MFVRSNDFFYAPMPAGIPLFDDEGQPLVGDRSDTIRIWDAGTELDEGVPMLGNAPNAKPEADGVDVGMDDPVNMVRMASGYNNLPAATDVIALSLDAEIESGGWIFTATLTNASDPVAGIFPTPASPGAFAVFMGENPIFDMGVADRGEGLEDIAEDGDPSRLAAHLESVRGVTALASPAIAVVHSEPAALFMGGMPASGGVEALAEDGNVAMLEMMANAHDDITHVSTLTVPVGEAMPGPIGPGQAYESMIMAQPGDVLSFATMYVPSNDALVALPGSGIALFNDDDAPIGGDQSEHLLLLDAGTEVNQFPGFGLDQVHLQGAPNTGDDDSVPMVRMDDGEFPYGAPASVFRLSIIPVD